MPRRPAVTRRRRRGPRRRLRIHHLLIAALALVGFVGLRIWDPAPVAALRLQGFDLYQRIKPRPYTPQPVVIVDIDDDSLREYGQWPWPRTLIGSLITELGRLGAVVIAFDVVFAEPDRLSAATLADQLPGLDETARAILRAEPSNDELLAQAMRRTRVILAQAPVGNTKLAEGVTIGRARKTAVAEIGGNPRPFLLTFDGLVRNLPALEQAAVGIGSIAVSPEADGVARRVPILVNVGGDLIPSITVEMLRIATGRTAIAVRTNEAGVDSLVIGNIAVSTDSFARKWVHFAPPNPVRYVSARDVIAGRVGQDRIAGRLVIVGASATSLGDIKATPVSPSLPGVEVHAQLLETILSQSNLVLPNYALGAELVLTALATTIIVGFSAFSGALATLFVGLTVVTGLIAGSWYLYTTESLLIDVAYPAVAGFAVYSLLVYTKYVREESGQRMIRSAFQHYLAPELIERLAEHPEQLRLGGEIRELTILFSDVRGFTSISENLNAEELTTLVNRVLTCKSNAILRHQGTIDKYIGDCVMAFWNAPLEDPAHPRNACLAALEIVRDIAALNEALAAEAQGAERPRKIAVGVGLNTGETCVGNMGSTQRFNYSVLGDPVNLSSRLEGQTKFYGCPIIAGETTVTGAPDLAFLELDLIRVKGKERPSRIFALLGGAELRASAEFARLASDHGAMIEHYRARRFDRARDMLDACRSARGDLPLTRVYDVYGERITAFLRTPPEPAWDGVYEALQK